LAKHLQPFLVRFIESRFLLLRVIAFTRVHQDFNSSCYFLPNWFISLVLERQLFLWGFMLWAGERARSSDHILHSRRSGVFHGALEGANFSKLDLHLLIRLPHPFPLVAPHVIS
jgi:hypothetical protein